MKIHFAWLIPLALIAGLVGAGIERTIQVMSYSQQFSLAGQTLADISVTLENEKEENRVSGWGTEQGQAVVC